MIARYWQTIRHLRAGQMLARVRLRTAAHARAAWPGAAMRLYNRRVARSDLHLCDDLLGLRRTAEALRQRSAAYERQEITARNAEVARGRFEFLNEPGELGWPPDWTAPSKSQLWRYHLHYFDVLLDLALAADRPFPTALALINHWIDANPIHGRGATRDAWHPYVVSLRTVNWMLALSAMGGAGEVPARVRHSLSEHALFIERNLETDVGGNHLLKNLKAMVFAGCFWTGSLADLWRRRFGSWFVREVERQLLLDGGHYERSPMYHSQVLADAIEISALLVPRGEAPGGELLTIVKRMDRFLTNVTHPDGQVALFNDSTFDMAPVPEALHRAIARFEGINAGPTVPRLELLLGGFAGQAATSSAPSRTALSTSTGEIERAAASSGYVAVPANQPCRYLLADVGAVCPDDLPAHAHADLLSFELSLDGRRILVDSGVGEYAPGPWRDYYRSTRAHNTVMVDRCEQSDCWASFRVGRRASPANVSFRRDAHRSVLEAEHTGYDHLAEPVRHGRRFVWTDQGFWVVADALFGRGQHTWSSFCHLHPDAAVIAEGESSIRIAREETVLDVCWCGFSTARRVHGQFEGLQGWYAERFGFPVPATVLVLEGEGVIPVRFGYALIPQSSRDAPTPVISMSVAGVAEVRIGGRLCEVDLTPPARVVSAS